MERFLKLLVEFKDNPVFVFRNFRYLFISRVISAIGDKLFMISLMWWVVDNEKKISLSFVMAATFVPVILFSPFIGVIADRYSKKNLMLLSDISRVMILCFMLYFLLEGKLSIKILLILVFLIYSFSPMFETSVASSLVSLTSPKHLSRATAIDSTSVSLSNILGAMVGSVIIAIIGFKGSIIVNIVSYLLSFISILMIKNNLTGVSFATSHFHQILLGLEYVKNKKRYIFRLLIFFAVLNFFVSPILMLIPVVVKSVLNRGVRWLSIAEIFFSTGALLASFAMSFKSGLEKKLRFLFFTIFSFSIGFLISAISKNPYLTSLAFFVCGFSLSIGNVLVLSYFQHEVDNEYKGRFFSLVNMIVYAIMPISFIFNGFLLDRFSIQWIISFNSLVSIFLGIIGLIKFRSY